MGVAWRQIRLAFLAIGISAALAGCAANGPNSPAARHTSASNDPYKPYIEITSANLSQGTFPEITTTRLHGRRERATGATTTHARVNVAYHGFSTRHYDTARNDRAQPLRVQKLPKMIPACRRQDGCVFSEEYLVDIPAAELRAARQTGYRFKLFARSTKDRLVILPPAVVDALFVALDQQAAPAPGNAPPPAMTTAATPLAGR